MRALQRRDQVRRVPAAGRRAGHRPRRDRPLRAERVRGDGRSLASAAGRRPREGPDLHAPHARPGAARAVAVPGGRHAEGRDPRARRAVRPAGRVQAGLAGAVLRAERRRGRVRAIAGAGARAPGGRGRRRRWPRRWASTTARSPSRSASGAGSGVALGEPAYVVEVDAAREPRRGRARASCWRAGGSWPTASSWVAGEPPPDGPFEARGADALPRRGRPRGDRAHGRRPFTGRRFARRSARSRRARARWSTAATSSSAAAGSSRRSQLIRESAEPGRSSAPLVIIGFPTESDPSGGRVKLLRRRAKSFEIQVQDLVLHITRPRTSPRSRARPRCRSGSSCSPTRCATRRSARASGRSTASRPTRPTSSRRWCRSATSAGVGPMFTFRGAVVDQVGRFLAEQLNEVTVACDGDYFIKVTQADEARGEAPRRRADHGRARRRRAGVGVSTTLGRGRGGGGPDGLAVIADTCMLADAAAAGVQAVLRQARRVRDGAALPPAGAGRARRRRRGRRRIGVAGGVEIAA